MTMHLIKLKTRTCHPFCIVALPQGSNISFWKCLPSQELYVS